RGEVSSLSLHAALPIWAGSFGPAAGESRPPRRGRRSGTRVGLLPEHDPGLHPDATGPVGGVHLLLAERLDPPEPDRRGAGADQRSEEHTSELQSRENLV